MTLVLGLLLTQAPANDSVLRGFGKPYDVLPSGEISNHARIKIFNRENVARAYTVAVDAREMSVVGEENPIVVPAGQYKTVPIQVVAPANAFGTGKAAAQVLVSTDGFSTRRVLTLMGPRPTGHADDKHEDAGEHEDHKDDHKEKP